MQRIVLIERIRRQIYGEFPDDDAQITIGLVNNWLGDAIAAAAKQNYTESVNLDGVAYVNNSFYTTFSNLAVTKHDNELFSIILPQIPVGIGRNEGVASVRLKDGVSVSYDAIPLSANQVAYNRGRRKIPNKLVYWYEGKQIFCLSPEFDLSGCTAYVRMVSGGDSADLDSEINVPQEYFGLIVEYVKQQLAFMRNMPQDTQNDGSDIK